MAGTSNSGARLLSQALHLPIQISNTHRAHTTQGAHRVRAPAANGLRKPTKSPEP
jgi:hypothetical protein